MIHEDDAFDAPLARRARRAFRIALVCYLVPVMVATHWPRLAFQGSGVVDKFVHFIGFGLLAWLFLNAALFRRPILNLALAAFWVYFDEITQAIEILGRTFSWYDLAAGWLGCGVAGLVWWAVRLRAPRGSAERLADLTAERLIYARGAAWLRTGVTVAVFIGLAVALSAFADGSLERDDFTLGRLVYPIGLAFLGGAVYASVGAFVRSYARVARGRIDAQTGAVETEAPRFRAGDYAPALRVPMLVGALLVYPALWTVIGIESVLFLGEMTEEKQVDFAGFAVLLPIFTAMLAFAGAVVAASAIVRARRARRSAHAPT